MISLDQSVKRIIEKYDLTTTGRFNNGNSGALVLKCLSNEHGPVVLKVSQDERSKEEIRANKSGYEKIRCERLETILPDLLIVNSQGERDYILMSDLGDNFMDAVKKSKNPVAEYEKLCKAMGTIYLRTRKEDDRSESSVELALQILRDKYSNSLIPHGIISPHAAQSIDNLAVLRVPPRASTFACFDFTPEDIFLLNGGLKYPDPKHQIRGLPIIDLACFAGVSLDSYELPGSQVGYQIIEDFACGTVAELFSLSESEAKRYFYLGRALQLAISSKVRIDTEFPKAQLLGEKSLEFLQRVHA